MGLALLYQVKLGQQCMTLILQELMGESYG